MMRGGLLAGKIALVTGAASGIGAAIARLFAADGAAVLLGDRRGGAAAAVAEGLRSSGSSVECVELDVSVRASVRAAFDRGEEMFGPITVLINNAGIYPTCPVDGISEQHWNDVLDTNLKGPFLCCAEAIRRLKARRVGGSIVNVASTSATIARPFTSHYGASKAGLVQLSKVVAIETAPYGIRVNALCPGLVETETVKALIDATGRDEHEAKIRRIPMGRAGGVDEVARGALFLASDEASYITGTTLFVDGGYAAGHVFEEAYADQRSFEGG